MRGLKALSGYLDAAPEDIKKTNQFKARKAEQQLYKASPFSTNKLL